MTIKELKERLEMYDPDMPIRALPEAGNYREISNVQPECFQGGEHPWLLIIEC